MPETSPSLQPQRPVPEQLKWLTIPLLVELISNAIALLLLPFTQEQLVSRVQATLTEMGMTDIQLTPQLLQSTLWTTFFMLMALTLLLYYVREGVKAGKGWAWVMTLLVAVFSLFNVPFGPIISLALFYGAFRPEVRAYFGR